MTVVDCAAHRPTGACRAWPLFSVVAVRCSDYDTVTTWHSNRIVYWSSGSIAQMMALWWIGCLVMQKMYGAVTVWQWRTVRCSYRMTMVDCGAVTVWHSGGLYGAVTVWHSGRLWCSHCIAQRVAFWHRVCVVQWPYDTVTMMQWLYGTDDGFMTQSLYGAVTAWHGDWLWCNDCMAQMMALWRTQSLCGAVTVWHNEWTYDAVMFGLWAIVVVI